MAFATVQSWDETPASNTEIDGINIDEGCNPSGINNAIREAMAQVAAWTGDDTIASATTTDLSTVNGQYVTISGTTTITGFGTVKAGWVKFLKFDGALTLTHNATSLILPGLANITTAANDTAIVVSLGSGNWRCITYQPAAGFVQLNAANTFTANQAITSSDAGATEGPTLEISRLSASPAASDILGVITFGGKDSAGNTEPYAKIVSAIVDPTNASEDGRLTLQVISATGLVDALKLDTAATFGVRARFQNGSAASPSVTFDTTDTDTGFYWVSDGSVGVSCNGGHVGHWNSTGWTVATTSGATTFGSVNAVKNLISGGGQIDVTNTTGGSCQRLSRAAGSDGIVQQFHRNATLVGNVSVTGSATAYNTSSDERLKPESTRVPLEQDIDLDAVWAAIEPLAYNMVDHWSMLEVEGRYHGMLAQQLHKVYPQAVTVGEGKPGDEEFIPWAIDYSKLVPLMIARQKQFEQRTNERFAALGL